MSARPTLAAQLRQSVRILRPRPDLHRVSNWPIASPQSSPEPQKAWGNVFPAAVVDLGEEEGEETQPRQLAAVETETLELRH